MGSLFAPGSWVSQAVGWDSNRNVLKDPAPRAQFWHTVTPGYGHKGPLGGGGGPAVSFVLGMAICLLPTALKGGDCSLHLCLGAGYRAWAGSPPPQVHKEAGESPGVKNWFFLHFFLFPNPCFFSCPNTTFHFCNLSFAFFCLSAEGDPSPPFLYCLFYLSQFEIIHLWPITLSPWAPGDVSVTL